MPIPQLISGSTPASSYKLVRGVGLIVLLLLLIYSIIWIVFIALNPNGPNPKKQLESDLWTSTSHSWLDRIACRWLGICGGSNWLLSTWLFRRKPVPRAHRSVHNHHEEWFDPHIDPEQWTDEEKKIRTIPQYVFDYAPLIYLHEEEEWWPTDIAAFLHHVEHRHEGSSEQQPVRLSNLSHILGWDSMPGESFLHSLEDPEMLPEWLTSPHNIPVNSSTRESHTPTRNTGLLPEDQVSKTVGSQSSWVFSRLWPHVLSLKSSYHKVPGRKTKNSLSGQSQASVDTHSSPGGRSSAPAFLITVEKSNHTLDAFWFFFYAFNRGARVTGIQYGNHVGDWEHVLIRFRRGKPVESFLSAHEWGSSYEFDALEKMGVDANRPVIYAGLGSHAHYATPGRHAYALPFQLLGDDCSRGHLWDPALNLFSYIHRPAAEDWPEEPRFLASMRNPRAYTTWLEYKGRWGDKKYSLGDPEGRNYRFAGEYKYLSGPTGPWDKALTRSSVCEYVGKPCELRNRRDGYVGPIKEIAEIESFGS